MRRKKRKLVWQLLNHPGRFLGIPKALFQWLLGPGSLNQRRATAHGRSPKDLPNRPAFADLNQFRGATSGCPFL
jgi:hypothetical protein